MQLPGKDKEKFDVSKKAFRREVSDFAQNVEFLLVFFSYI
jgi:hypothetical protein